MKRVSRFVLTIIAVVGVSVATSSAYAFGGNGGNGMHGDDEQGRSGLLLQKMRDCPCGQCQGMTDEERVAFRKERQAAREERRAALEKFTGLSREERREIRRGGGGSIGDELMDRGITREEAEKFLTGQAGNRIDDLVENRNLSEEEEQTYRDKLVGFVQNILNRWFD